MSIYGPIHQKISYIKKNKVIFSYRVLHTQGTALLMCFHLDICAFQATVDSSEQLYPEKMYYL